MFNDLLHQKNILFSVNCMRSHVYTPYKIMCLYFLLLLLRNWSIVSDFNKQPLMTQMLPFSKPLHIFEVMKATVLQR